MHATLTHALRQLGRTPVFTGLAVGSLGLGIGLVVAVGAVVRAAFFAPFPVPEPDRLAQVWPTQGPRSSQPSDYMPPRRTREWVERAWRSLDELAAASFPSDLVMRTSGEAARAPVIRVRGDWFGVLGVPAGAGRLLAPADLAAGAPPAAVVSEAFRERWPAAEPGGTLDLSGTAFTVVGVVPARFEPDPVVWVPDEALPDGRRGLAFRMAGRLRPGATLEGAAAEVAQRAAAEVATDSAGYAGFGATARAWGAEARSADRPAVWLVGGAVLVVFLIGLSNLTGLFLARAGARSTAFAVRAALGAGPRELCRILVAEGAVVAAAAAAVGTLAAVWLTGVVEAWVGPELVLAAPARVGGPGAAAAVGLAVLSLGLLSLEPARHATRMDVAALLRRGGPGASAGPGQRRTDRVLVALQITLSVALVGTGGVLRVALDRFADQGVGYDADRLVHARPDFQLAGVEPRAQWELARDVAARLGGHPGVDGVATWQFVPQAYPPTPEADAVPDGGAVEVGPRRRLYAYYRIAPGSLEALGVPRVRGRTFTAADAAGAAPVVVVSRSGAEAWWPGEDPLGKRIKLGRDAPWWTVVGVVEDLQRLSELGRDFGMGQRVLPLAFRPRVAGEEPPPGWGMRGCLDCGEVVVAVRAADGAVDEVALALREAWSDVAPAVPLPWLGTMHDRQMQQGYTGWRLSRMGRIVAGSALVGLLLSVVGIAGVVGRTVVARTREIGIRIALGAGRIRVLHAVAGETLLAAGAGLVGGLAVLAAFSQVFAGSVFVRFTLARLDTGFLDPRVMAAGAGVVLVVALLAALTAARRALAVPPSTALRAE